MQRLDRFSGLGAPQGFWTGALATVFALQILSSGAQGFGQETAGRDGVRPAGERDALAAQTFDRRVTIRLTDVNLRDFCSELAVQLKTPLSLDERALSVAGIDCFAPISLHVKDISARAVVQSLLKEYEVNLQPGHSIVMDGRDGVPVITAKGTAVSRLRGESIVLEGLVKRPDDSVVPEARVRLLSYGASVYVSANPQGEFRIPTAIDVFPGGAFLAVDDGKGGFEAIQPIAAQVVDPKKGLPPVTVTIGTPRRLDVEAVDDGGKPVAGATIGILVGYGLLSSSTTNPSGRSQFSLPQDSKLGSIFALKKGVGFDYRSFEKGRDRGDRQAVEPTQPEGLVKLTLGPSKTVTLRVTDEESQPLVGQVLYPWYLTKPTESNSQHIQWSMFWGRTNDRGEATFDWLPAWEKVGCTFWSMDDGFEHTRAFVKADAEIREPIPVKLRRLVEVSGRVTDADGAPVANAVITATGAGYGFDNMRQEAKSDDIGRYWLKLAPWQTYLITAASVDKALVSRPHDDVLVYSGKPISDVDFALRPATRVSGQVTLGPSGRPVKGQQIFVYQYGLDLNNRGEVGFPKPDKESENRWVQPAQVHYRQTDADGKFEFLLGPGKFDIRGPEQVKVEKFEIGEQKGLTYNFHSPREEKGTLAGRVVTGDPPKPILAEVTGVLRSTSGGLPLQARTDDEGRFTLERKLHPTVLFAKSVDGQLAGITEVTADETEATITVSPAATYTAKIVGPDQAPVAADIEIMHGVKVHQGDKNAPFSWNFGIHQRGGKDGEVKFEGLVIGATYEVHTHKDGEHTYGTLTKITPDKAGTFDLGTIGIKPPPAPYKPPTLVERIEQAFERPQTALERHATVQADIALSHQREFIVFADPKSRFVTPLYEQLLEKADVRRALYDYRTMSIPFAGEKRDKAIELAVQLGVTLPEDARPLFVLLSADGKVVAEKRIDEFVSSSIDDPTPVVDGKRLIDFAKLHALPPLDARIVLSDALAKAKAENKRVLIQQTATWCGPCWSLSRFLAKHRSVWEKDFIWVKMDERWTNQVEVMKPIRNGADGGIPWMAVLDADGKVLGTSNGGEDGQNYGFPTESHEIKHFVGMLRTTGSRMTDGDADLLTKALSSQTQ